VSSNLPDFDKADYLAPQPTPQPAPPPAPIYAPQPPILSGDVDPRGWDSQQSDHARFTKALFYGLAAAVLGSILYAAFTIVTHIEISYLAIGVGYVIGKAMLSATEGHSSRKYQVAAAVLTYLSVSFAAVPEILWALHKRGTDISHLSSRGLLFLARYGVASPFLSLKEDGLSSLIGLFILFIGIRAAWKLTANRPNPSAF
jgi:hypothetical protein